MSRYRNFTTICCAAVFALGLAACGGGDDGISVADRDAAVAAEQAKTDALQMEINALRAQLGLDPEDDPAASIQDLQDEVARLQGEIDDAADKARMAQEEADRKAMAATAAKLLDGIGAPMGNIGSDADGTLAAGYSGNDIHVRIGTDEAISLMEDKKTMVADNHGWEGKRYADKAGGPMVEAMVYSNVGDPTPGMAFEKQYNANFNDGVLDTDITEHSDHAGKVASDQFDHTAGFKEFKKGENREYVEISGSFHGVSGTYRCDPGSTDGTNCAVSVAAKGFTLGATTGAAGAARVFSTTDGVWTFKPADPKAMVMSSQDGAYASYGWWIHKAANDGDFTASAFVSNKNTVTAATGLDALNGKATYMGGAAGKYALASSTGGTNDAGHFTAMVTLEADFNANTADADTATAVGITGMIDNFMGADGMPRDWSVKLNGSPIANGGGIGDASDNDADNAPATVWTIGENAAKAAGSWTGTLYENKNGVPQVATGTFNAKYGSAGSMVGAFGANKQ